MADASVAITLAFVSPKIAESQWIVDKELATDFEPFCEPEFAPNLHGERKMVPSDSEHLGVGWEGVLAFVFEHLDQLVELCRTIITWRDSRRKEDELKNVRVRISCGDTSFDLEVDRIRMKDYRTLLADLQRRCRRLRDLT